MLRSIRARKESEYDPYKVTRCISLWRVTFLYQMKIGPVYQMATRSLGAMYMPSPSVMP